MPSPSTPWASRAAAAAAAALAVAISGCVAGPNYKRPAMPVPTSYKEAPGWKPAAPRDAAPRGPWWQVFDDAELDALQQRVTVSNQNLRAAAAGYDQALALARQARAGYFPTVSADVSQSRSRAPSVGGASVTSTSTSASLSAAWEIDLWGRVRRSVEASTAAAQASLADLEGVRLSMQAQLAQDYFLLRVVDGQIRLLAETVTSYERSLQLTRNRYKAGVVARADVAAAEAQLASARAQHIDATINRAQLEHAIAVLTGAAPADFSLPAREGLPSAQSLPEIPALLPAELLERRPDIASAERRAAQANARIGIAQSAYFPTLSIGAAAGVRAPSWSDLISAPTRVWSLGPDLAALLFDGGARRAGTDAARAAFDQASAQYRQTVLSALQEVEDNLVVLRVLEEEAKEQREAVRAARESLDHTDQQYRAGVVSYLNVITAQAILFNAQSTELGIRGRQLNANVALIRALGGGWSAAELQGPPQAQR